MAEYSGWVNPAETKAAPQVDWGSVVKGVTDKLQQQEAGREAKRQESKKATDDLYKTLGDISAGQNQGINKFVTDASYQAKNTLNEAYKLYTSGKMSGKDYANIRNNVQQTFANMKDVTTSWQTDYGRYADGVKQGVAGAVDEWNQKERGQAMDLSNKGFFIDPTSGIGYIGDVKNGQVDKNTLQTPKWIKDNGSALIGKVDVNKEANDMTKNLGKFQEVMKNPPAGGIWTMENASQRPGFDSWLEKAADAIASDPLRMASILADNTTEYDLTGDPNAAGGTNILMQKDMKSGMNMPQLTPDQEKKAKDIVKNTILQQINSTLSQVENTYHPPQPRQTTGPKPTVGNPKFTITPTGSGSVMQTGIGVKSGNTFTNVDEYGVDANGNMYIVTSYTDAWGDQKSTTVKEGSKEFAKYSGYLMNPATNQPFRSIAEAKAYAGKGGGGNQPSQIPTYSRADLKAKGWTDAQINEAVKQNKFKVK